MVFLSDSYEFTYITQYGRSSSAGGSGRPRPNRGRGRVRASAATACACATSVCWSSSPPRLAWRRRTRARREPARGNAAAARARSGVRGEPRRARSPRSPADRVGCCSRSNASRSRSLRRARDRSGEDPSIEPVLRVGCHPGGRHRVLPRALAPLERTGHAGRIRFGKGAPATWWPRCARERSTA